MTLTFSLSGITEAQKRIREKGKNLFLFHPATVS